MPTYTTTYSLGKPVVGADEDAWGDTLNTSLDAIDDILDGTTPVTGIDINSGTLDGVTIGGTTAGAGTFTTLTANTSITGTLATAAQTNITSVGTLTGLTVSGSTSLAGASTSADITFGDNDKAIFGAGSDLQIYHDGTHSYIRDAGTGSLFLRSASNVYIQNAGGTANYFKGTDGGASELFHSGISKLATTSTGVDVTGTVTADGLTVETASGATVTIKDTGRGGLQLTQTGGGTGIINVADANEALILRTNTVDRLNLASNGDISFYEDTGTTAKFFWDASAESLGIGTSSPARPLQVAMNNAGATVASLKNSGATAAMIGFQGSGSANDSNVRIGVSDNTDFTVTTNNSEAMRIDSSGNVGIGTSSPSGILQLQASNPDMYITSADTGQSDIYFGGTTSPTKGRIQYSDNSDLMAFWTNSLERMRIDSSGNVGIGTTPETVTSTYKALELGYSTSILARTNANQSYFGNNVYPDSGWKYKTTDPAALYQQVDDQHVFFNAASGTADTAVSFSEAMRIDSSGNVGIGTSSPESKLHVSGNITINNSSNAPYIDFVANADTTDSKARITMDQVDGSNGQLLFYTEGSGTLSERMRIDSSGNLLVGTTTASGKLTVDGDTRLKSTYPIVDNIYDVGTASFRWDDIFATNGTIQTSDRNEKQDIAELSEAEQRVAVAAKGLLRKFRWKDAVAEKGDEARTHFGIIAQDLQAAFAAEGLDAGNYAMFIHTTWNDEETGEERSRMGVRYSELLAFIIAAI